MTTKFEILTRKGEVQESITIPDGMKYDHTFSGIGTVHLLDFLGATSISTSSRNIIFRANIASKNIGPLIPAMVKKMHKDAHGAIIHETPTGRKVLIFDSSVLKKPVLIARYYRVPSPETNVELPPEY